MDIREVKKILDGNNVPEYDYSLDGGLPNEAYCIGKTQDGWETYYSERGLKSGLKSYTEEEKACEGFLEMIKSSYDLSY